jgi:hypothetical protein
LQFFVGLNKWCHLAGLTVPACVSLNTMPKRKLPRASAPVVIDGGGFTRVVLRGGWDTTPREHAEQMQWAVDALGREFVSWVAPMDMMCEAEALKATGLSLIEHQRRTVDNYIELTTIAPQLPWLPVLQGWQLGDYLAHVEMYAAAGIDLFELERVGVGSVCRRQGTKEGVEIITALVRRGLRVHAFGFKASGLKALKKELSEAEWSLLSADSMAWSKVARLEGICLPGHDRPGPGRRRGHRRCTSCREFALMWREGVLTGVSP